ncbi:MAG: ABC transporter ATP-binding protein [Acetobacteraceae bacterium]|nr:ABC transporter ATP-binding protein [Acetobacteraceae bacterium]
MTAILELQDLTQRYAGLVAVDGVSLCIEPGGVFAVIGPNGAGKTTLFDLVSGLVRPSAGRVRLYGRDVTGLPADRRAALGLGRTFQNIRIFGAMTVLENALTGLHAWLRPGVTASVLRLRRFRAREREAVAKARAALDLVGLGSKASLRASSLSYGDQRRLEIARAMAPSPRLLLLDEPAAGMNPAETAALATLVRRICDGGTTVLLVEHDMGFVMTLSDRIAVLNFGRLIAVGSPAAIRQDPAVVEAYLGPKIAAQLGTVSRVSMREAM